MSQPLRLLLVPNWAEAMRLIAEHEGQWRMLPRETEDIDNWMLCLVEYEVGQS